MKSFKFFKEFLLAMSNVPGGQSLRKWLAVGCFWVLAIVCIRYTDKDNVVSVITILSSLITALAITYTTGNIMEKRTNNTTTKEPAPDEVK